MVRLLFLVLLGAATSMADEGAPTASISSHVLDTTTGVPASNLQVIAYFQTKDGWQNIGSQFTDYNGRIPWVTKNFNFVPGTYKLVFLTKDYYDRLGKDSFYPEVQVPFIIKDATQHYHVPITLSPFGYSTYRGS